MKSSLRKALLAAALGSTLPAVHAVELITVNGKVPPVMDAVRSAWREEQQADDPKLPLAARIERAASIRYTPETADKLRAVFGTERLYSVERQPGKSGGARWHMVLPALHYRSAPEAGVDWDAATLDLDLDKAGKNLDLLGKWSSFSAESATTRVTAQGMRMSGRQRVGYRNLWFGKHSVTADSLRLDSKPGGTVEMEKLRVDWGAVERPKSAEMAYSTRIGAIAAAGERVEDVRVALRLTNIDKDALAELDELGARERERQRGQAAAPAVSTPEQQFETLKPYLRAFVKSALRQGTALEIDEIGARYHGQKVSLRGRVELAGLVPADLGDLKGLTKKIAARFEVRIPVALVREIAGSVAAKQAAQMAVQKGQPVDEQGIEQMRQSVGDIAIGKIVSEGYAAIEGEVLVSRLEYRDGRLTANGKEVALPKPSGPTTVTVNVPDAVGRARLTLRANALQARLIEDSCRLPDYPEEAVRQDLALRAVFSYRVDAEGRVRDANIAQASSFPDWDQAALAALNGCRYIPALQDGKPVALEMAWTVKRQAGTTRPQGTNGTQ